MGKKINIFITICFLAFTILMAYQLMNSWNAMKTAEKNVEIANHNLEISRQNVENAKARLNTLCATTTEC